MSPPLLFIISHTPSSVKVVIIEFGFLPLGDARGLGEWVGMWERHAYSRKYSRFARLDTLGFKTPYFRNLPAKNNT